jgi:hypothetical protein
MSTLSPFLLGVLVLFVGYAPQIPAHFRRGEWEDVTRSKLFAADQVSHVCVRNGTVEELLSIGPHHPCSVVNEHSDGAVITLTTQCKGNEKGRDFQARIQIIADSNTQAHGNMQVVINKNGIPADGEAQFTLSWQSDRCTGE